MDELDLLFWSTETGKIPSECPVMGRNDGSALAYDLAHSNGVDRVIVADINGDRAKKVAGMIGESSCRSRSTRKSRAGDPAIRTFPWQSGRQVIRKNVGLTQAAISAAFHFCDLGGNMDVVDRQISLRRAGRKPRCLHSAELRAGARALHPGCSRRRETLQHPGRNPHPGRRLPSILNHPSTTSCLFRRGFDQRNIWSLPNYTHGQTRNASIPCASQEPDFPAPFGKLEAFTHRGGNFNPDEECSTEK